MLRELLHKSAIGVHVKQLADEIIERDHPRAEEDLLPVGGPANDDVVWAHAIGDVVAAEGGRVGQPHRRPALSWHAADLRVAVVLAREGDGLAVPDNTGEHVEPAPVGEPPGTAARSDAR